MKVILVMKLRLLKVSCVLSEDVFLFDVKGDVNSKSIFLWQLSLCQ